MSAAQGIAHRGFGGIVPQSQTRGGDSAFGDDGSRFDNKQTRTAIQQITPVH